MHHIALHDFVPGLTQIAISPLGDMPVIRAEFARLVRRRIDAGVCDKIPLAMKAADISDLRDQTRSQCHPRCMDAWYFAHERIFRQSGRLKLLPIGQTVQSDLHGVDSIGLHLADTL